MADDFGAEFYDSTGQQYLGNNYWATPTVDIISEQLFPVGVTTVSVSYPELAGSQLQSRAYPLKTYYVTLADDVTPVTVAASFDYSLGYPVGTYTRSSTNYVSMGLEIYIYTPLSDNYGYQMFNAAGELSAGAESMSYVFKGKYVVPLLYSLINSTQSSYPSSSGRYSIEWAVISGKAMWTHEITLPASMFTSASRPILMVDVPAAPAAVRVHHLIAQMSGNTYTGGWILRLAVLGGFSPTVYVFDRVHPSSGPPVSSGYGMEVFNASGSMIFSTNQKMLATVPRQTITLTTPKNGSGTFSTVETYAIPAMSGGGVPLITPTTPRSMVSVDKHSKNFADLHGYYSKFWSRNALGHLECKWVNIFADGFVGSYPYTAQWDYAGGFVFEASNSIFYA